MVNYLISKELSIVQKLSQFSCLYLYYYFTYYICINSTAVFRLLFSVPLFITIIIFKHKIMSKLSLCNIYSRSLMFLEITHKTK